MTKFNSLYKILMENLKQELIVERFPRNRYDRIVRKIYNNVMNFIVGKFENEDGELEFNINLDNLTGVGLTKYVCSLNDNENKFEIIDDSYQTRSDCVKIFLSISENVKNERGFYDARDGKRDLYIFISKNEIEFIRKKPSNEKENSIFNYLIDEIYGTIRHEPQHLSEFGKIKRNSLEKFLDNKFENGYGFEEMFDNQIINSSEFKLAVEEIEKTNGASIKKLFINKVNKPDYALKNNEISAKCAEIMKISLKRKIKESDLIIQYINNQYVTFKSSNDSNQLQQYNDLYKIPEVQEFYKKMKLFLINVFVNSMAEFYPSTMKRFDKIELYGSTYNFDKESKTFK